MANANQVIVNGETILDLRSDTVTPETLQKGYTAHDKSGTKITGTLEASSLQSKSVTYTSNGTATLTPDAGYDGLSSVDVTVDVSGGEDAIIKRVTFIPSLNYVLSSDKCVVTHNCGKIPKAVFMFSDNTNNNYVGYGYIFNFSGSNDTGNVSLYNSLGVCYNRYRVAFTTTTMKFTMDSSERYNGGKHYYFTFVC